LKNNGSGFSVPRRERKKGQAILFLPIAEVMNYSSICLHRCSAIHTDNDKVHYYNSSTFAVRLNALQVSKKCLRGILLPLRQSATPFFGMPLSMKEAEGGEETYQVLSLPGLTVIKRSIASLVPIEYHSSLSLVVDYCPDQVYWRV
jgi:hypothetical protein